MTVTRTPCQARLCQRAAAMLLRVWSWYRVVAVAVRVGAVAVAVVVWLRVDSSCVLDKQSR